MLFCKVCMCGRHHKILSHLPAKFLCAMNLIFRKSLPICVPRRGIWECQTSRVNILLLVKKKKNATAMKTFPSGGSKSCFRGNLYCLLSFLVAISFSQLEHFVKTSLQQSYCWVSFYTSYLAGMTRHSTVGFACSWFSIHLTF